MASSGMIILIVVFLVAALALIAFLVISKTREEGGLSTMMSSEDPESVLGMPGERAASLEKNMASLRKDLRKKIKKKAKLTLEEKLFRAGLFSQKQRDNFARFRMIAPVVTTLLGLFMSFFLGVGGDMTILIAVGALLFGLQIPISWIDRRMLRRQEDMLYFLPVVIEQLIVGVSSSLDIGPCIQNAVSIADERESHNVVTYLLKRVQLFVKQGIPLEEALMEIGALSGSTELKHTFSSLAQVAVHGGEVSRQLQELAESATTQRETKIEAKIKKLELEATGPVAMVFAGFLMLILTGFFLQIIKAL